MALTGLMAFYIGVTGEQVFAGTLTIEGYPNISAATEAGGIRLSGKYEIENKGDETANAVAPQLEIGSFIWEGDPRVLPQNKRETWQIDALIDPAKLQCTGADRCAGLPLPSAGNFPLLITRHYQDVNGYRFSAADVRNIVLGMPPDSKQQVPILNPAIDGKLGVEGDGTSFTFKANLLNSSTQAKRIAVSFFTSRELRVLTPPQVVDIPPSGLVDVSGKVENFSGLIGSTYAVFIVTQWEENGLRNSSRLVAFASLKTPPSNWKFISLIAGLIIAAMAALYFAVFADRRGTDRG